MFNRVLNQGRNVMAQAILHGGKGVGASWGAMRGKLPTAQSVTGSRVGTSIGGMNLQANAARRVSEGNLRLGGSKVLGPQSSQSVTPRNSRGIVRRAGGFARRHPTMTTGAGMGAAGFATGRMTSGRGGSGRPTPGQTIRGGTPGAGGRGPVGGGRPGTGRPTV